MGKMTVPVTPMQIRLRINPAKGRGAERAGRTMLRWLQRCVQRTGNLVNIPSFRLASEYDPATRTTWVYGSADTVPNWVPAWLANVKAPCAKEYRLESPDC